MRRRLDVQYLLAGPKQHLNRPPPGELADHGTVQSRVTVRVGPARQAGPKIQAPLGKRGQRSRPRSASGAYPRHPARRRFQPCPSSPLRHPPGSPPHAPHRPSLVPPAHSTRAGPRGLAKVDGCSLYERHGGGWSVLLEGVRLLTQSFQSPPTQPEGRTSERDGESGKDAFALGKRYFAYLPSKSVPALKITPMERHNTPFPTALEWVRSFSLLATPNRPALRPRPRVVVEPTSPGAPPVPGAAPDCAFAGLGPAGRSSRSPTRGSWSGPSAHAS